MCGHAPLAGARRGRTPVQDPAVHEHPDLLDGALECQPTDEKRRRALQLIEMTIETLRDETYAVGPSTRALLADWLTEAIDVGW